MLLQILHKTEKHRFIQNDTYFLDEAAWRRARKIVCKLTPRRPLNNKTSAILTKALCFQGDLEGAEYALLSLIKLSFQVKEKLPNMVKNPAFVL